MTFTSFKNNRYVSIILVITLVFYSLFSSFVPVFAQASEEEIVELKILHTNDIHARVNDFGKIAAYIQAEREAATHSLFLDAGDIFSGNPVVDLQYGKPIVDLLNHMGLDAMAIGNHDFDYGQEEMVKRINESTFPWLSANTTVGDGANKELEQPEPYKIFDVDGIKVGVFSVIQSPPATAPANTVGITFADPIKTAKEYEYLTDETDILIALTHIGYSDDRKLAEEVGFFDLIIGGHSHTTLNQPAVVNGTPIVQTGGNALNVGNVTINYNQDTKEVESVTGFLQNVSQLTAVDQEIQEKVDAYNAEMGDLLDEVIGKTETGLNRSGNGDTQLGNFWTDSIRYYTKSDIALTNNGGIRANIPAGDIKKFDIYTIEPFANEIMKIEMTGAAVKEVIKYSYERRNSIDLQTSGLTYKIITNNTGRYIDSELKVDGQLIEDDKMYIVAVGDYIGTGGSGYNFAGEIIETTSGFMTDSMIAYAKHLTSEGKAINYQAGQRITFEVSNDAPIVGNPIGETKNGLSAANNRTGDSGLGNLYADSVRAKTNADFGMLNSSSVTGSIAPGVITDGQIEFLDQFGNQVVAVKTTVKRMKEVLLEQSKYNNGVDLQVSGLHYELIKENGKFVDVKLTLPDGNPLDEGKQYTVAYNDYMHGAGFYNLGSELVGSNYGKVWEAIVDYVKVQEGPIDYVEGSRITIIDDSSSEPVPPPADRDYVTVAEAIANNSGKATVQGYIVGTMTSATNVTFDGEFTTTTNLVMADSPNERDLKKLIPVQLPNNAIRTALNLKDNPDNLGKLVQVSGTLEAYFTVPGVKTLTSYDFVTEAEPVIEPISISEARTAEVGKVVTVEATATTDSGFWGQKGFYLQDDEAGIYVFQSLQDVKAGDVIRVTGEKGIFAEELQITNVSAIEKVGEADIPQPLKVSPKQITAENEGQLVVIESATISNLQRINNFGTFEFDATVKEETVRVRVDNRTGLVFDDFEFANGDSVNITGISSRFNNTIQLKPRGKADMVEVLDPYEVEISLTDGKDTVSKLERNQQILVQTKVKNNQTDRKDVIVAVTLVDKHGRKQENSLVGLQVSPASENTVQTFVEIPTNHQGQQYVLEVTVYEGSNLLELNKEDVIEKVTIK
ncbi:5'-nucleotidase C-terminal domain-containing protein [Halalkalibacter akibai]|uniref:5'-nucleotidase n=1 Tax=Halalkalibacter akibai (strain ATCC 43226 / DSM 21942 / CIP 109018 / JCM 9157 / 1139) TaxID=1236973 RepID=W4QPX8_HALA3|nr:5'-nucleotidase C-terminal domain-containing protein [Halalkalibacter akibai]GAE33718.1 5'-nucleotidase [Halalkalibacter akibai JCM 9157]